MDSFETLDLSGSNTLTDESIRNHFKQDVEPWQPVSELIWNGLDAGASNVDVHVSYNQAEGTDSVLVCDNGSGIDFLNILGNFRRFNDSLKKRSHATRGSKGRGRLAFHKICNKAMWSTRFEGKDALLSVDSATLSRVSGNTIPSHNQHRFLKDCESGTVVELTRFIKNLPDDATLREQLAHEHGWHLALNHRKKISVNGVKVVPPENTQLTTKIFIEECSFEVTLIQWKEKPKTEKSRTYLIGSQDDVVHSLLSRLNNKPEYFTSLFVKSDWFDQYTLDELISGDPHEIPNTKIWKLAEKKISEFTQEHYNNFLRSLADLEVGAYEQEGDFPDYSEYGKDYSSWRRSHTKSIVRAVIIADPRLLKNSSKRQRKIIIQLLDKISVSSENEAMLDVLESVLELDASEMNQFSDQLKRSRLNNIIQTIETLQRREIVVQRVSEIMRNHYRETLETPDLQGIIEANTWLFGNHYETIGAEEDTFTKIACNLRAEIKDINKVESDDVDEGATVEGANRQVDLFMVRKIKQLDSNNKPYFRCVIIEIKRPSIALNHKHLLQVEDYAAILNSHPDFNGINTVYEIVLVGRKISDKDYQIKSRLDDLSDRNDPGLIGAGRIKRYVKTWATILEEFELSTGYLMDTLKTQRDCLENETKETLIKSVQQASA